MAKPVTQQKQPKLRIKLGKLAYSFWLTLGNKVKAQMTANVGLYPTPSPTLVQLQTHLTALQSTIAALGTRHNKGGNAQILAVRVAVTDVQNDLKLLAAYVVNTVDNTLSVEVQRANLNDSGFTLENLKSLAPTPQFIKFIKQSNNRKFPSTLRRLSWKKPLGTPTGQQLVTYNIYDKVTGNFLLSTTKTNVQMNTGALSAVKQVVIKPLYSRGEGNAFTATVI